MRFFKYLVFLILSIISINSYANWKRLDTGATTSIGYSPSGACVHFGGMDFSSSYGTDRYYCYIGSRDGPTFMIQQITASSCTAGATTVQSGNFTIKNWANESELYSLQDQSYAHFSGSPDICASSCLHKFSSTTNKSGDETTGQMVMTGVFVSTATSCTSPTSAPDGSASGTKTPVKTACQNGESYCDKPPTGCPSGYSSGNFNGKQICVKNSTDPDPDKPNPNDPNNNNFDDTGIIAAINEMSSNISTKLTNISTEIKDSISQMSASVTDAIGVTNGKLDQVKAEIAQQKASIDAVKSAVDSNTNAVNANGDKIKGAVDANTTATNQQTTTLSQKIEAAATSVKNAVSEMSASITDSIGITNGKLDQVKEEIAQQKESIDAVKSAVDSNTQAVNANGDKIKGAIDANTTAVNANGDKVKTAVDQNTEALNANGDKIKGAVDGNTEAVKEGNGILQDIKDWLTGDVDTSGFDAQVPEREITKQSLKTDIFVSNAQCPQDRTLSLNLFAGRSFQKTFSFQMWCDKLSILGTLILIAAYAYAAHIIVRTS